MTSVPPTPDTVPFWLVVTMAVLVGLLLGSFLNVVVYRVPRRLSVSKPRSFCPTCDRQLAWWENVPLVSWVALRGRCHVCKAPISARYPLVEAANAVAFGLIAWAWHGSAATVAYCLLASTVLAITLSDLGSLRSPLILAALGTVLGDVALLASSIWGNHWTTLVGAQVGVLLGTAGFALLRRLDPGCHRAEGIGRGALIPAGCWLGGLVLWPALLGLAAAILVLNASLIFLWRSPTSDPIVSSSSLGATIGRGLRTFIRRPLLVAVTVGMAVGLLAHP